MYFPNYGEQNTTINAWGTTNYSKLIRVHKRLEKKYAAYFFSMAQQPLVGQCLLIIEAS
jgi:hypothetical protein